MRTLLFCIASALARGQGSPPATGLVAWYKNVSLPGSGSISSWADSSGNAFNLTPGTGTAPVVLTLNGTNYAYFAHDFNTTGSSGFVIPSGLSVNKNNVSIFMWSAISGESSLDTGPIPMLIASLGSSTTFGYAQLGSSASAPFFQISVPWSSNAGSSMSWGFAANGFVSSPTALTYYQEQSTNAFSAVSSGTVTGGTIGGSQSIGSPKPFVGAIGEVLIYSGIAPSDVPLALGYLAQKFSGPTTRRSKLLVSDGTSIAQGYRTTNLGDFTHLVSASLGTSWQVLNFGWSSHLLSQLVTEAAAKIDPLYNAANSQNIVSISAGVNDLASNSSAAAVYADTVTYCQARRAVGWKVIAWTVLPIGAGYSNGQTAMGYETSRQSFNSMMRANIATDCPGAVLADVGNDAAIGQSGDETNTMYYVDLIHPSNGGHAVIAPYLLTAVQSFAPPFVGSALNGITAKGITFH